MKTKWLWIGLFLIFPLCVVSGARVYRAVVFDRDLTAHLKRAADANTVELAMREVEVAINYLDQHGVREGYTSVVYNTPDEDIGFWYQNLQASLGELRKVTTVTTQLERSNVLIKLRETLLDGQSVTEPAGISAYPHNAAYFWIFMLCGILAIVGTVMVLVWLEDL